MSETDRRNRRLRQRLAAVLICIAMLGTIHLTMSQSTSRGTDKSAATSDTSSVRF